MYLSHDLSFICISDFVIFARSLFRSFDYKRLAKEYSDESTCKYMTKTKTKELNIA